MNVCTKPHRTQITPSAERFIQSRSKNVIPVVVIFTSRRANTRPPQTWQARKDWVGRMKTCTGRT